MQRPYAELLYGVERPFLLYLALLLHDVGKAGNHGDHSIHSERLALRVARRLRLDPAATRMLRVIIVHHLLLASISQRRDLDDPAVIRHVARQVNDSETLRMLTLHTFVDTLATSDKLWNGFKDSLLWTLYSKTLRLLSGGPELARAEELQRENLKEQVRKLARDQVSSEEIEAHFSALPQRYFQVHTAREILQDLLLANQFMRFQISEETDSALAPVVHWLDDRDRGCNTVKVCTWDRAGLFGKVAGCFSAAGLTILSAQIFTRMDGIVLDTFFVIDARTGSLATADQRKNFQDALRKVLLGGNVDLGTLIARQKITRPLYNAYVGERMPTHVRFDNETSDTRTLVEIETEDRVGLLYQISQTLSDLSLDISGAKITTEKGAAIDSFYLRESDGKKVIGTDRHQDIEARLREAIAALP
jgi:[protein-PII] uridylyltransferase